MLELFIPYVFMVIIIIFLRYFDNSLRSVQRYHKKLLDYNWEGGDQLLLKYCCICSLVCQGVYVSNLPELKVVYGYNNNFELNPIGITFTENGILNIVFVSTSNLDDVYFGIQSSLLETKFGMVHNGYMKRFNGLYTNLLFIINQYKFENILLYGHSLGGVMASLVGLHLNDDFRYNCSIKTFGSPRWGNCQVKDYVNNKCGVKIKNYINSADPVTKKPNTSSYTTVGYNIVGRIDTNNDNVNHGIKIYREIVSRNKDYKIIPRGHRIDELISRSILDLFS